MKNKKLLVLLPAVALMLAGCGGQNDDDHSGSDTSTTSDTSGSTTGSTTDTGSTGTTDTSSGTSLPDGVTEADFGTADAPITLAQAKTLIDKLIPAAPTTAKETKSFLGLPIFLKAKSTGNDAKGQYDIFRTWLQTDELKFTVMNALPADGVTGGDTANGFAGKILTVKGYGALYLTEGGQLQYEIVKKDNDDKPSILKAEDSGEHHAEPAPINKTFAELYAMSITSGDDVKNQLYVSRGKIKAFKTGSTKDQYGNMTLIDPTDASKEIVVYGASASNWLVWQDAIGAYNTTNPKDFMTNAVTKDLAVGDIIDFTGVCYTHSGVKQLSIKVTGKYVPTPESVAFSEDAYNLTVGQDLYLSTLVTLTPGGSGTLNYEIVGGTSEYATLTGSSLHGDAAGDVTVKVSVAGTELNDTAVVHVNPLVPESVRFNEDELNLYVGEDLDLRSHAVLDPADSGELSYSIIDGDSFATLDGYTLTGAADGDVTVKVEVVGYPTLNDTIIVHVSTAEDGVITDIQSTGSSKTMYFDGTDDEKTVTFEVVVTSNGERTEGVIWEIASGSEFVTISYAEFPGDDTHCVVTLKEGVETTGFVEIVAKAADHPTDYHVQHDVTIDQHAVPVDPYGDLDNPLSTSEAIDLIDSGDESLTTKDMYVIGTIVSNTIWNESFKNMDLVITDGTKQFTVFRTAALPGYSTDEELKTISANQFVGYSLVAHGKGKLFKTTYELDAGCTVDTLVKQNIDELSFKAEEYTAYIGGESLNLSTKVVAKIDGVSTINGLGTIKYSINESTVLKVTLDEDTGVLTVAEGAAEQDIHITVSLEEEPSIYDEVTIHIATDEGGGEVHVATLAKGDTNSYDTNTVNGQFSVKLGKSGSGGNAFITVDAGTTSLTFHAAAWNKEGGNNLTIEADGITITPASIPLTANSTFAGTATSFTGINEDDYEFTVTLSGVTAETKLTLTYGKRCFIWGVSAS